MAIHQYKVYHFQEYVDVITDVAAGERLHPGYAAGAVVKGSLENRTESSANAA